MNNNLKKNDHHKIEFLVFLYYFAALTDDKKLDAKCQRSTGFQQQLSMLVQLTVLYVRPQKDIKN